MADVDLKPTSKKLSDFQEKRNSAVRIGGFAFYRTVYVQQRETISMDTLSLCHYTSCHCAESKYHGIEQHISNSTQY